jgi:hypothetical protein
MPKYPDFFLCNRGCEWRRWWFYEIVIIQREEGCRRKERGVTVILGS